MANYSEIWKPRVYPKQDYGSLDRPEADLSMFYQYDNHTWTHEFVDFYTGGKKNFGATLTGGDNKIKNLQDCWRHASGYGQTHALCKLDNWLSWHLGAIPVLHKTSEIKKYLQHVLPGYGGMRFEYRWPYDNDRNFWSNSPVHINDMMLHYYNCETKGMESYGAELNWASPSSSDFYPDRYVGNSSRRSDTWKGCYWEVASTGGLDRIRTLQLALVGMSVEMKYSNYKSASHSRCMDIRNLTPIYSQKSGHNYVPLLAKPRTLNWDESGNMEFYLV